MRIDLLYEFYSIIMYFIINYMSLNLLYGFYSMVMDYFFWISNGYGFYYSCIIKKMDLS